MEGLAATTTAHTGIAPPYWTLRQDASGQTVLSYAVRGGKAKRVLGLLGGACIAAGAWGAYWLLSGGGLTLAGVVLLVLVPGGLVAFGAHCLDTVFWARRDYLLGARSLISRRYSLRGGGIDKEIERSAITGVVQRYTPPGDSEASGSEGTWTTFLAWRRQDGRLDEYPFGGMGSSAEALWLGPIVAGWAGVLIERGRGPMLEQSGSIDSASDD